MSTFQDFEGLFDEQVSPAIQRHFTETGAPPVQIVSGLFFHLAAELHMQGVPGDLILQIAESGIAEGERLNGSASA